MTTSRMCRLSKTKMTVSCTRRQNSYRAATTTISIANTNSCTSKNKKVKANVSTQELSEAIVSSSIPDTGSSPSKSFYVLAAPASSKRVRSTTFTSSCRKCSELRAQTTSKMSWRLTKRQKIQLGRPWIDPLVRLNQRKTGNIADMVHRGFQCLERSTELSGSKVP